MTVKKNLVVSIEVTSFGLIHDESITSSVPLFGSILNEIGIANALPNASYFLYNIQVCVVEPEVHSFEIKKRFSQLSQLDETLSSMTKFLPYFPPRGAHRILTTQHGQDRMKMLNTYFHIVSRMEEVIHTTEFLTFFGLTRFAGLVPNKLGQVALSSTPTLNLSSFSVSSSHLVTAMSSSRSILDRATNYISSMLGSSSSGDSGSSQIEIWKRLPNSYLCERRVSQTFPFRVHSTAISDLHSLAAFGTSDGRVGFLSVVEESENSGFLPGLVHAGAVTVLHLSNRDSSLWSGGEDGFIQQFSLNNNRLILKLSSNGEGASVTSILSDEKQLVSILFIGLSSGVVSIFNQTAETLRLVTLLQGPSCPVITLNIYGTILLATHAGVVMDVSEGVNTVQFWDVSDVLSRGTSKLAPWGPAPAPIIASSIMNSEGVVAVLGINGTVNIFSQSRSEVTNRAKWMFKTPSNPTGLCVENNTVFVGTSVGIEMWQLPPFETGALDSLDISSAEVCHTQPRTSSRSTQIQQNSPAVGRRVHGEDDLHSWAR